MSCFTIFDSACRNTPDKDSMNILYQVIGYISWFGVALSAIGLVVTGILIACGNPTGISNLKFWFIGAIFIFSACAITGYLFGMNSDNSGVSV